MREKACFTSETSKQFGVSASLSTVEFFGAETSLHVNRAVSPVLDGWEFTPLATFTLAFVSDTAKDHNRYA